MIPSSFQMQYNIDLRRYSMSYQQFIEYLAALSKNTPFGYVMYLRRTPDGDLSDKEKQDKVKHLIVNAETGDTRDRQKEYNFFTMLVEAAKNNKAR